MIQPKSLRFQLLFSVAVIVLLGFAITVGVITTQAASAQRHAAMLYAQELAERQASEARNRLEHALSAATTLAHALAELKTNGRTDRDAANDILRGVLAGDEGFLGVWSGWEPNAFDGQDSTFAGKPGHDNTGRFVPYWNRGGGNLQVEPLVGYDKSGDGDYYQLAKKGRKPVLLEPYSYAVAGVPTLLTTVAVPIMVRGEFMGVAGIDIALSDFQVMVEAIRVMDVGRVSLISNGGFFVGDPNAQLVGKAMESGDLFDQARSAIRSGQSFKLQTNNAELGTVTQLYVPVRVGATETPWSFRAELPQSKIMEAVVRLQWMAIFLALLSVVIVSAVLAYALEKLVLRPIGGEPGVAAQLAERVAHGDLTVTVQVRPGDQTSLMARLDHMQHSLIDVVERVRQGAQSVAMASSEISQGNHDLSARTENQASAIEQTSASMEELSGAVHQNDSTARQANQLAQDASHVARQGGEVVQQVVRTMRDIQNSSKQIAQIISVIDGIAFQTNILALNAAVEAARAGEHGRGFAVVAGEVRTLAQRSAEAAKDIKRLIEASVQRVDVGTDLADKAGSSMEDVVTSIQRVTALMAEISVASSEQNSGVQEITHAVSQMDQTTQENAALVEEMAAAAMSLKGQAADLVQTVSVFRLSKQDVGRMD